MSEAKQVPAVPAVPVDEDELIWFDALTHKVAPSHTHWADAAISSPGMLRFFSSGVSQLGEVSKKRGQADLPRRVKLAWRLKENQMVMVPTEYEDKTGVVVTYKSRQTSGSMTVRSFLKYIGLEILKDSEWNLKGQVLELPKVGWCLVFDLDEMVKTVVAQRKAAAAAQEGEKK